jgi:A/G-specific adenine glycosylase
MSNVKKKATPSVSWSLSLLDWYYRVRRTMPWRDDPHPYAVWISEIMLQQTRVSTVIPYFENFMRQFPTVEVLARSDQQMVLKAWEGLGYYSRARNLHRCAQQIVEAFGGEVPDTYESLLTLPGIGPYCGAAIASIAFGKAVPAVDGNVLRVGARFFGLDADITKASTRVEIFERLRKPIDVSKDSSGFNQGMIELGATLCAPKNPLCSECPLQTGCVAQKTGRTAELPVKKKKAPTPHYEVGIGIIWNPRQKILLAQRREDQMLGGLWEFPGGKQRGKESLEETVKRKVRESTGVEVSVGTKMHVVNHVFTHFSIRVHAYLCQLDAGKAKALEYTDVRWVKPEEISLYPLPAVDKKIWGLIQPPC